MPLLDTSGGSVVFIVVALIVAVYALGAYPLYRVAKLTGDHAEFAGEAWVPVMNVLLMCRIAGVNPWTALILLIGVVPVFGLVNYAYAFVLWVKIGKRFGRTGLGVLAGVVPIIGAWVFAFVAEPEVTGS